MDILRKGEASKKETITNDKTKCTLKTISKRKNTPTSNGVNTHMSLVIFLTAALPSLKAVNTEYACSCKSSSPVITAINIPIKIIT
uniref:hypothetical protein n=1 Tax=Lachnospira sp. TaxID=2049031 RepID=UPI004026CCFE